MQIHGQNKYYFDFFSSSYINMPVVIIVVGNDVLLCIYFVHNVTNVGVAIFIIAFCACCGAVKENSWMVYAYSVVLLIILLAQFGAGITAFVMKDDLKNVIENKMVEGMDNYGKYDYGGVTETWDYVQAELDCCGVNNYTDWWKAEGNWVWGFPDSCCKVVWPILKHNDFFSCLCRFRQKIVVVIFLASTSLISILLGAWILLRTSLCKILVLLQVVY